MNKKIFIGIGVVILSGIFLLGSRNIGKNTEKINKVKANGQIEKAGTLLAYLKRNGSEEWQFLGKTHNVFTDEGKNYTKRQLGSEANVLSYVADDVAVGNTSVPTATSGSLPGELTSCGFSRANGTYGNEGTGKWNVTHVFTSTCDNVPVNTSGLYCSEAGASYDFFVGAELPNPATLYNGDNLKIIWKLNVTGA